MAAQSFEAAYRSVKRGELKPVYYLTGDEEPLKQDLITAILDQALTQDVRDFNLDVRQAGDLDGESLHALVETPPMLAERRVVVVRGLEQWRRNAKVWDTLFAYLDRPSPTTVLVLVHGAGEKPDARVVRTAVHVTAGPLTGEKVRSWLIKRARTRNLAIDDDAADHLIAVAGGDLAILSLELDKLGAAAAADQPIRVDDVVAMVGVRRGETLHDWIDAVLARDLARAADLLEPVLAQGGVNGVRMIMTLGTALLGVRLARAFMDDGTPRSRVTQMLAGSIKRVRPANLRDWGSEPKRWAEAAAGWTAADLDRALAAALDADRQLKSTTASDERGILLSMLLTGIHNRAAA